MLDDFLKVWDEVSQFIAPSFRPNMVIKDDYSPYGANGDFRVRAAVFNNKYAAFEAFSEWSQGADKVVRLEQIHPDEELKKRWEAKGLDPSLISEARLGNHYSTVFFLAESILSDFQEKLRLEGKDND